MFTSSPPHGPWACSLSAVATISTVSPLIFFIFSLKICTFSNFLMAVASRTKVPNNASCSNNGRNA